MIEDSVWKRLPADYVQPVREAIACLAQSGVLKMQVETETLRLLGGDPTQDPIDLAREILRVRADTRGLENLHEYGLQITQELKNRDEEDA
jgi:hypothetical protein